jgi:hypothetical protein
MIERGWIGRLSSTGGTLVGLERVSGVHYRPCCFEPRNNPTTYRAFANRVKMFLTRDVEWRNRIVSAFREAVRCCKGRADIKDLLLGWSGVVKSLA